MTFGFSATVHSAFTFTVAFSPCLRTMSGPFTFSSLPAAVFTVAFGMSAERLNPAFSARTATTSE